jgi:hypothetical protein
MKDEHRRAQLFLQVGWLWAFLDRPCICSACSCLRSPICSNYDICSKLKILASKRVCEPQFFASSHIRQSTAILQSRESFVASHFFLNSYFYEQDRARTASKAFASEQRSTSQLYEKACGTSALPRTFIAPPLLPTPVESQSSCKSTGRARLHAGADGHSREGLCHHHQRLQAPRGGLAGHPRV